MELKLKTFVLDAPDIRALADFYTTILDWTILDEDDDWITIVDPESPKAVRLAIQHAPNLVPPTWPDDAVPQQAHLDFSVDDIEAGEARVLAAGARPTGMPTEDGADFRVYLDPAGHPFCLCF